MCLMAPARVVATDGETCEVQTGGRVDRASMMLEPDLQVGDWVLVNSGTVVRKLDPDQAEEMTRAIGILFGLSDETGQPLPGGAAS
jgi:hydrogenase assembly chaperone HypC/HupF